jgi:hypothetical protein
MLVVDVDQRQREVGLGGRVAAIVVVTASACRQQQRRCRNTCDRTPPGANAL